MTTAIPGHQKMTVEVQIDVCSGCVNSLGYNVAWEQAPHHPPADDVREALESLLENYISGTWSIDVTNAILAAFEVRPRGVVTEADVDDAVERIRARLSYASLHWGAEGLHPDALPHIARAALEAARGVHP